MRHRLRRFAGVGLVVTALDVAILLALRLGVGVPVVMADAAAVAVAAAAGYALHRWVTFGDDPHVRWVEEPATFAWVTLLAAVVDVAAIRVAVAVVGSQSVPDLLVAKAASLAAAGAFRFRAYRSVLFERVRDDQSRRVERTAPPGELRFSVVVPAYREQDRIAATVARLREALAPLEGHSEIVVVDDGSPDATAAAARSAGADQVLALSPNRGKGAAVRAGMLAARGRAVAFTDADLAYPPEQLLAVLGEVEAGWDVVVGSRRHVETVTLVRARRLRDLSGRLFNSLTRAVVLGNYRDTQCGLKAMRADVARLVFSRTRVDGFAFDVEVLHLAERWRLSLKEVPVTLANTRGSTVRVGVDAARMVRDLFRIRRWAGRGLYDLDDEGRRLIAARGGA